MANYNNFHEFKNNNMCDFTSANIRDDIIEKSNSNYVYQPFAEIDPIIPPFTQNAYTSYINIDSRHRTKYPVNIYESKICNLDTNPIEFTNGSSKIKVYSTNHNFKPGQNVSINNIISKNFILNSVISIKKNSNYFRINHSLAGLSLSGLYSEHNHTEFEPVYYVENFDSNVNSNILIPDTKQYYILKINHNANLYIQLDNIQGKIIGNINTDCFNGLNRVYILFIKNQTKFEPVRNAYVIKLLKKSSINYKDNSNICIKYNNLFGVPLSYLNNDNSTGRGSYMSIISTAKDYFVVDVGFKAIIDPTDNEYNDNNELTRGGGSQAYLRLVSKTTPGYENPNDYLIILDKVYRNVTSARIISSSFPNSNLLINKTNNKLYWKNIDDGNNIYSIIIPHGNYTGHELQNTIEELFANTIRCSYTNNHKKFDENGMCKYHNIKVIINEVTNTVTFTSYKQLCKNIPVIHVYDQVKFELDKNLGTKDIIYIYLHDNVYLNGFIEVNKSFIIDFFITDSNSAHQETKSINTQTTLDKFTFNNIFSTVQIINHQLQVGDIIITDKFIPQELFIFEVTGIINENSFRVKKSDNKFIYNDVSINLPDIDNPVIKAIPVISGESCLRINHENHNLEIGMEILINAKHKYTINRIINEDEYQVYGDDIQEINSITFPDIFQLCFNFPDTIGDILGFDKEYNSTFGKNISYSHKIYNNTKKKICSFNSDYFYICCKDLISDIPYYYNTGNVTNVFAQLYWDNIDNSFVPSINVFNRPINILRELHIQIRNSDGELVDLNDMDHSFVIEITEVYNQPIGTDISARINSEINSHVV